jgi:SAM-dependent methyltransferase
MSDALLDCPWESSVVASPSASQTRYGSAFYRARRTRTLHAAETVLGILFDRFDLSSLIDVGCGTGTWLQAARVLGATRVVGIEGAWLPEELHDDPSLEIVKTDLEQAVAVPETFDLCVALEVAEHLSPQRAASFVDDLCQLSNRILFSAAIPGQGGSRHSNEQWQSYWAELFNRRGYVAMDLIRPMVWNDASIPYWYRQNVLVYLRNGDHERDQQAICTSHANLLDVVHPELFARVTSDPTVDRILRLVAKSPRALSGAAGRWWSRRGR